MFSLVEKCPSKNNSWTPSCVEFDQEWQGEDPFGENDPDTNPVVNLMIYFCGMIHRSERYEFSLNLEDAHKRLPIDCEMLLLLEQLDDVLSFLRHERDLTELVFCEQEIMFRVYFSRTENAVHVRVKEPTGECILHVDSGKLARSFSELLLAIFAAITDVVPLTLKQPAFEKWFRKVLLGLNRG